MPGFQHKIHREYLSPIPSLSLRDVPDEDHDSNQGKTQNFVPPQLLNESLKIGFQINSQITRQAQTANGSSRSFSSTRRGITNTTLPTENNERKRLTVWRMCEGGGGGICG